MENTILKQLREDFKYLEDNISFYLVDEDDLVNHVAGSLLNGTMDLSSFVLWSIKDIVNFTLYTNKDKEDIEFLKTDKRAIEILNRCRIEI